MEIDGIKINTIEIRLPIEYSKAELEQKIARMVGSNLFSYDIVLKSLDARNKRDIHWKIRINVFKGDSKFSFKGNILDIKFKKRDKQICVVGSGPAGFFAGYVLQKAGYETIIIERGSEVAKRSKSISKFEQKGELCESANYAFGEGGAGTFSDGKLTSRTKNIDKEKNFVIESYIEAGAPEEIRYLSHPHIGTNNLIKVVRKLRQKYEDIGGKILFETTLQDIVINDRRVVAIETDKGKIDCDYLFVACGHSAYDTYRLLLRKGVKFQNKAFAIGSRVEHLQEIINLSQWGRKKINGLKAAEYKLTHKATNALPVYSFCMCPGGKIVQASPRKGLSIVNGMSYYSRSSPWANSAIVAGIYLPELLNKEITPNEALDWLEQKEQVFYELHNNFELPANIIQNFIEEKRSNGFPETSYSFGLFDYDFRELFPDAIYQSLRKSLIEFSRKIKGFGEGVIMGFESKTSSPIQVIRDENYFAAGYANLYVIGEGSGRAGGIISSAVDGIKAATTLI